MKIACVFALLFVLGVASAAEVAPINSLEIVRELGNDDTPPQFFEATFPGSGTWSATGSGTVTMADVAGTGVVTPDISTGFTFGSGDGTARVNFGTFTGVVGGTVLKGKVPAGIFTDGTDTNAEYIFTIRVSKNGEFATTTFESSNPAINSEVSLFDASSPIRINNNKIEFTFSGNVVAKSGVTLTLSSAGTCGQSACDTETYTITSDQRVSRGGVISTFEGESFSNTLVYTIADVSFLKPGRTYTVSAGNVESLAEHVSGSDISGFRAFTFSTAGEACPALGLFQDGNDECQCGEGGTTEDFPILSLDTTHPTNLETSSTQLTGGTITISYSESVKYQHLDETHPDLNFMAADGSPSDPTGCLDHFTWSAPSVSGCTRTWTGTIDSLKFFNGDGGDACKFEVISAESDPDTDVLIRFQVTHYERVQATFDDGDDSDKIYLTRTLTQLMPFRIKFPKQVTVTDSITVYSSISVLRAVVEQFTYSGDFVDGEFTVTVLTNANAPYVMSTAGNPQTSVDGTPIGDHGSLAVTSDWAEDSDTSGLACDDTSSDDCTQRWTATFKTTTARCDFDGVYAFTLTVGCRDNNPEGCPSGGPGKTVTITMDLDTGSICPIVRESVGLQSDVRLVKSDYSYFETDPTSVTQNQRIYFKSDVVAPEATLSSAQYIKVVLKQSADPFDEFVVFDRDGPESADFNFVSAADTTGDVSDHFFPTCAFDVLTTHLGLTGTDDNDFDFIFTIETTYTFEASSGSGEYTTQRSHRVSRGRAMTTFGESASPSTRLNVQADGEDAPATQITRSEDGSHVNSSNGILVAAGVVAIACVAAAFVAVVRLNQAKRNLAKRPELELQSTA